MWVQWPPDVYLLATLCTTFENLQVSCHSPPLLVLHSPRLLIADPGVGTTSTRVNPHNVLEAEIVTQRLVYHLNSHSDELPALDADICLVAACPNIIVICQIDIEAELFSQGPEGGQVLELFSVAWVGGVDGADFETRRQQAQDVFADAVTGSVFVVSSTDLDIERVQICRLEGLISQVGIVL